MCTELSQQWKHKIILVSFLSCKMYLIVLFCPKKAMLAMTFSIKHQIFSVFNAFFHSFICNRKKLFLPFSQTVNPNIFYWDFHLKTVYSFVISILCGVYLTTVISVNFNWKFSNVHTKDYTIEYYGNYSFLRT